MGLASRQAVCLQILHKALQPRNPSVHAQAPVVSDVHQRDLLVRATAPHRLPSPTPPRRVKVSDQREKQLGVQLVQVLPSLLRVGVLIDYAYPAAVVRLDHP
eukprot:4821132-Prymnesium_polylepis.1